MIEPHAEVNEAWFCVKREPIIEFYFLNKEILVLRDIASEIESLNSPSGYCMFIASQKRTYAHSNYSNHGRYSVDNVNHHQEQHVLLDHSEKEFSDEIYVKLTKFTRLRRHF